MSKELITMTTGGYKIKYVTKADTPSLADYAALFMAAGYSYKFVCRMLGGLNRSSLFQESDHTPEASTNGEGSGV